MKTAEEVFPAPVLAYIESTRFSLPEVVSSKQTIEIRDAFYDPFVQYLKRIGDAFGIQATVGLVYTDMMRSEAITIGGQSYIAHDQYFGQVINMMNRMFLYGASKKTKVIYFHKVASQVLSRYGFYPESTFAANLYRESRKDMDHIMKQRRDGSSRHGLYTTVQELFVLLHEQSHVIFKHHPDLLNEMSADVRAWLVDYAKPSRASATELQAAMQAQGWSEVEQTEFREQEAAYMASMQLRTAFCEEIVSRKDLVEEFCCDQLALINVLGYFAGSTYRVHGEKMRRDYSGTDKITAVLLCFLNMRTLQMMEAMCALEKNADFLSRSQGSISATEGVYETFYSARLHRAKDLCYDLALNDDEDATSIHMQVSRLMDHHTDEIFAMAEGTLRRLLYEKELRPEIERVFEPLTSEITDNQHLKRTVTAMLHLIPDRPEDGRTTSKKAKKRSRNGKKR
ncbi:hypothetical protein [Chromobacterium sp. IIBBL 290-4]|uniref:hypothetical protein n=1 Tax=Chromobacterium sp. IIBBL 290-4 TaxID=2953890 RepID=UPI0020B7EAE5|nr:hypothetical protein [Chromobacterium sp. IIBBL 290-4]UTH74202.1 hypothetical protein NKT35_22125 [Chromobacterium sp. IIBBL 290-4]